MIPVTNPLTRANATVSQNGLLQENAPPTHFQEIRAANPKIDALVARRLKGGSLTLNDILRLGKGDTQASHIAAFMDHSPAGGGFCEFALNADGTLVAAVLLELARFSPTSFCHALKEIQGHHHYDRTMEGLVAAAGADAAGILAFALMQSTPEMPNKYFLDRCSDDLRLRIAVHMVLEQGFHESTISLFTKFNDLYALFCTIINTRREDPHQHEWLTCCLVKMSIPWLALTPFNEDDERRHLFCAAGPEVFGAAIDEIGASDEHTDEIRIRLLRALDWNRIVQMSDGSTESAASLLSNLLLLAPTTDERMGLGRWINESTDFGSPFLYPDFLTACVNCRFDSLIAYSLLALQDFYEDPEQPFDLTPALNCCIRAGTGTINQLAQACSPDLRRKLLNIPLILTAPHAGEEDDRDVVQISTVQLMESVVADPGPHAGAFLNQLPVVQFFLAMHCQEAQRPLAEAYSHLHERRMRVIEKYLPPAMLNMPVMLPHVRDLRAKRLAAADAADFQLCLAHSRAAAEQARGRIRSLEEPLGAELEANAPDKDRVKRLRAEYAVALKEIGDPDPAMRTYLAAKREREPEEDQVLELLQETATRQRLQLQPGGLMMRAQQVIFAVDEEVDDSLPAYIFTDLPKPIKGWKFLMKVGVVTHSDLRVIGLDTATQEAVEEYRQKLAALLFPADQQNAALAQWRRLSGTPVDQQIEAVTALLNGHQRDDDPPLPHLPANRSCMLPSVKNIGKSWLQAMVWVVQASAVTLWREYSEQDDLVGTWKRLPKGNTLSSLGVSDRATLCELKTFVIKRRKTGDSQEPEINN